VGENGEAEETCGRGGTRGRRMVMGAEKHGIICDGRRLMRESRWTRNIRWVMVLNPREQKCKGGT
jgi:hypothetical protein